MAKRKASARMEEVTDLQAEKTTPGGLDLVGGLIFVTFVALLLGIVMAQMAMNKYFDSGLFGG